MKFVLVIRAAVTHARCKRLKDNSRSSQPEMQLRQIKFVTGWKETQASKEIICLLASLLQDCPIVYRWDRVKLQLGLGKLAQFDCMFENIDQSINLTHGFWTFRQLTPGPHKSAFQQAVTYIPNGAQVFGEGNTPVFVYPHDFSQVNDFFPK